MRRAPYTVFLLAGLSAWGQETKARLTVAEAVAIALKTYPDVAKAQAAADQLKGKVREVRAQALPEININSYGVRARDPAFLNSPSLDNFPPELLEALKPVGAPLYSYSATVKQPLYTAGKVGTALRLAAIEAEGAAVDIGRAEQDLALAVVRAFYGLIWAERFLEVAEELKKQKIAQTELARSRFKLGVATEVDVLRSEVDEANGEADVVRARNVIRQVRALLNNYLSRPIDFPTEPAGDFDVKAPDSTDVEQLALEAERRRPELQRLRIAELSAKTQIQLANAESRMSLDFTSSYGIVARLPKNLANPNYLKWDFGVNFTLPVFDGFRRSGLVWQATAYERQVRLERQKALQLVRRDIQMALDDLRAAEETMAAAQTNVRQAERVLQMMQNNYKYGAATTLDIINAQTALAEARRNLLRGRHDYTLGRAQLRYLTGATPWE